MGGHFSDLIASYMILVLSIKSSIAQLYFVRQTGTPCV